jgi:hypothetical protein
MGSAIRQAAITDAELVRAARILLQMEATGPEPLEIPLQVCEHVARHYEQHDRGRAAAEWPAYLRLHDRIHPTYRN